MSCTTASASPRRITSSASAGVEQQQQRLGNRRLIFDDQDCSIDPVSERRSDARLLLLRSSQFMLLVRDKRLAAFLTSALLSNRAPSPPEKRGGEKALD
jgi:hypothetical protein